MGGVVHGETLCSLNSVPDSVLGTSLTGILKFLLRNKRIKPKAPVGVEPCGKALVFNPRHQDNNGIRYTIKFEFLTENKSCYSMSELSVATLGVGTGTEIPELTGACCRILF